jgi:TM2 domain-containing membrane protein YozV
MKCENCQTKIKKGMRFCPHCGKKLFEEKSRRLEDFEAEYINVKHPKRIVRNRTLSALLAFFGGSFGLQHIYNGHTALGLVCAAFFWTGIPGLFGIINCIQYVCCDSDEEFTEKYCIVYA